MKHSFLVCEKRLASGWFVYSLIEIKQRFRIPGPISSDIDQSLADYHVQIRDGFYTFWGAHKCDVSFVLSYFYLITNTFFTEAWLRFCFCCRWWYEVPKKGKF